MCLKPGAVHIPVDTGGQISLILQQCIRLQEWPSLSPYPPVSAGNYIYRRLKFKKVSRLGFMC